MDYVIYPRSLRRTSQDITVIETKNSTEQPQSTEAKKYEIDVALVTSHSSVSLTSASSGEYEQKHRDSSSTFSDLDSICTALTDSTVVSWIPDENEENVIELIGQSVWAIAEQTYKEQAVSQVKADSKYKIFEGETIPRVSLGAYLCRINKYFNKLFPKTKARVEWGVSPGLRSIVMGLIYLDRILEKTKKKGSVLFVNYYNVHRLMMAAIFLAAKFLEDDALPAEFLSGIAGIKKKQLAQIESLFCCSIDFDLRVTEEEFLQTYDMISKSVSGSVSV